jgi:hypothetical protein
MTPKRALIINALVQIAGGVWGYFGSDPPAPTSIVPAIFAVVFLVCVPLFQSGVRPALVLLPILHGLLFLAIAGYIVSAARSLDWLSVGRNAVMAVSCIWALVVLARSFGLSWRRLIARTQPASSTPAE